VQFAFAVPVIIPTPTEATFDSESFSLTENTVITYDSDKADLKKAANFLAKVLKEPTSYKLEIAEQNLNKNVISFVPSSAPLKKEAYELEVTAKAIIIKADDYGGAFNAIQTLRQLSNKEIFSKTLVKGKNSWSFTGASIKDAPSVQWRGMHLDFARHFFDKEFVFKYLDNLSIYKINRFHMHLTDDQGWRIEIKKYPKLTEVGAFRKNREVAFITERGHAHKINKDNYGGFFTQTDIKEIVAYAAERNIQILPEVDLPGHIDAIKRVYPELIAGGAINVAKPEAITFVKDVLKEVAELFPFGYVHIGGDEVGTKGWLKNPLCQELMKKLGAENDPHVLSKYFGELLTDYLETLGKKSIVWHESFGAKISNKATIMVWGEEHGKALRNGPPQGYDVIGSTYHDLYLKGSIYYGHYMAPSAASRPTLEKIYNFTPFYEVVESKFHHHIKGLQACMWTEKVPDGSHVEFLGFPRMHFISEIAWVEKSKRMPFEQFSNRSLKHYPILETRKINLCFPPKLKLEEKNGFVHIPLNIKQLMSTTL